MQRALFIALIIAMIAGIVVGAIIHGSVSTAMAAEIAGYIKIGSDIFLRMIKMIIAPLILTTLSAGIAHVGGGAALGRIGARTMAWFITASFVSLALGLLIATLLAPGAGFDPTGLVDEAPKLATAAFSLREFLSHVFPTSFIEAMAKNEVLQIVVFSLFLGTALQAMGPKAKLVTELLEQGGHVMLKITGYVMTFAPVAVFAALAAVVATQGLGVLVDYGRLVGSFYIGLLILWALLVGAGFVVLGPSVGKLIGSLRDPLVLAFATASSEAAYPRVLAKVEEYGVANRVASFVLPLGYSFNLDGSMMYCTFAAMFIAQALGVEITLTEQILMLLLLMVTSKGIAGVPRASLVVIAATLPIFGMPAEAIGLVLAVDAFMDMGRSATNVIGNSIACAVVAKWEGLLRRPGIDAVPAPA